MPNTKNKIKQLNFKKITFYALTVFLAIILGSVSIFAYGIYKDTAEFSAEKLVSAEPSKLYDAKGNLIYTYGSDENGRRENVTYNQLPQVLVDAIVAAEDSRFFEHKGYDLPRIIKAAFSNLISSSTQGGSTITQQVIKKSYFSKQEQYRKSYGRKISEVILAAEATKKISKEEIITLYLNKIYFGRSQNSIGIGAASKYYFNKEVSLLTLPEAALLAGALNSPYNYDPYYDLPKATRRRDIVLNLMVHHGYITKEEADKAKAIKVENMLKKSQSSSANSAVASYVDLVTEEVIARTGKDPSKVQMKIHTFYDSEVQELAVAYASGKKYRYSDSEQEVGGIIQGTQNGRIIAAIGGRNYKSGDLNRASVKQQPGSSVKPFFDYGAAYKYLNWSTTHSVEDKEITINGYTPKNWDNKFHGKMTIYDALKSSWNTPAVTTFNEVLKETSTSNIIKDMEGLGIDMSKDKDINLSYAIGGWETGLSPIELAQAYATIANNGKLINSHTINYIEDLETNKKYQVDEDIQKNAKTNYDKDTAYMIRQTMLQYTTAAYSQLNGISNVAAKSGTTNFNGNRYVKNGKAKENWSTAYTPDYTCSFWMGFTAEAIKKGKNNTDYPAKPVNIVGGILKFLQNKYGNKNRYPDSPENVIEGSSVFGTFPYKKPSDSTPPNMIVKGWFKKDTLPNDTDNTDYSLSGLNSFSASLNSSGNIQVNFGVYSPVDATTNPNATEGTKNYGLVQYAVDVTDPATGAILYSTTTSSNSGYLNYIPNGSVNVTGYYKYANSSDLTSNKITVNVSKNPVELAEPRFTVTDSNGHNLIHNSSTSAHEITVTVSPQAPSNKITITCNGQTSHSPSVKISALQSGATYTLTITESNGNSTKSKTITFKVN